MDVEILEDVLHNDLRVGDQIIAHAYGTEGGLVDEGYVECEDLGYNVVHVSVGTYYRGGNEVYWGPRDSVWSGQNHRHRVKRVRAVSRVPCIKCGKSLHPELVKYTHGC